jgi:hypothetical protein
MRTKSSKANTSEECIITCFVKLLSFLINTIHELDLDQLEWTFLEN